MHKEYYFNALNGKFRNTSWVDSNGGPIYKDLSPSHRTILWILWNNPQNLSTYELEYAFLQGHLKEPHQRFLHHSLNRLRSWTEEKLFIPTHETTTRLGFTLRREILDVDTEELIQDKYIYVDHSTLEKGLHQTVVLSPVGMYLTNLYNQEQKRRVLTPEINNILYLLHQLYPLVPSKSDLSDLLHSLYSKKFTVKEIGRKIIEIQAQSHDAALVIIERQKIIVNRPTTVLVDKQILRKIINPRLGISHSKRW